MRTAVEKTPRQQLRALLREIVALSSAITTHPDPEVRKNLAELLTIPASDTVN